MEKVFDFIWWTKLGACYLCDTHIYSYICVWIIQNISNIFRKVNNYDPLRKIWLSCLKKKNLLFVSLFSLALTTRWKYCVKFYIFISKL